MKQPKINDILRLIVSPNNEKIIGRLEGYRNSDVGQYVVIKVDGKNKNIFRPSIIDWKILK